jgi:hypothetical protein
MNNFSQQSSNLNSLKFFILVAFFFLTSTAVFAQDENHTLVNITAEISVKQENTSNVTTASNLHFVLWFMGTKQDPNATISRQGTNTKKQFMTSGMAPNRLLIKAFLKKAVNFERALA